MRVQHFQLLPLLAFQKLSNHTSKPFQPCRRICPTMLALVIGGTFDSATGGTFKVPQSSKDTHLSAECISSGIQPTIAHYNPLNIKQLSNIAVGRVQSEMHSVDSYVENPPRITVSKGQPRT